MKFYNREEELKLLDTLAQQSEKEGVMTVLTGRRRVGKTMLALEFCGKRKFVYFFIAKKSEQLLCGELLEEIREIFDLPVIGEITRFRDIFALMLQISEKEHFTLIIDEFQEFYTVNPSVYSEIQNLWDRNKAKCRLNLIFIGSIYSLIHKIFQDSKEPLFNRADRIISMQPFSVQNIMTVLRDYRRENITNLFDYYIFTGGIPRYIDILVTNEAFDRDEILDLILQHHSPFLNEGKNLLIEEFGKEYGTYFSLLELISRGKTARSEMESILEKNVGGFLDRLENEYSIIEKHKPINAKPDSRIQKYKIKDNFLNFWFRFIFKNRSAIETGNFDYVKNLILRDFSTYSGIMLERFFRSIFSASGRYNRVGSYWEKGNLNEIDLVAVNDMQKRIVVAEIKMNSDRLSISALKNKAARLLTDFSEYEVEFLTLSLDDTAGYL